LLGLSDPARILIGKREQKAWLTAKASIEAARRDAQAALGEGCTEPELANLP
jgi:hypothetical protein